METITQTIHNASNAFWNEVQALQSGGKPQTEHHEHEPSESQSEQKRQSYSEEPMAGIQGKGTATDPYDAGNREDQECQENTAVIAEPLASITPALAQTHLTDQAADQVPKQEPTQTQPCTYTHTYAHPHPRTPDLGPGNPIIDEPSPLQKEPTPTSFPPVATIPVKQYMIKTAEEEEEEEEEKEAEKEGGGEEDRSAAPIPQTTEPPSTRDNLSHTYNSPPEQRTQMTPSTTDPYIAPPRGESSSTAHKQQASAEAPKGPEYAAPRAPRGLEKRLDENQMMKEAERQHEYGRPTSAGLFPFFLL
ncbi:hypothetical protein P175DRAFT_083265 [Aspergillus ochraceoroseus IBT 24754]|uniref:Uncharacterized protein n=1 Tax=Aspergillus ochraceoroseus IBT 24754 TaxID=1392256 RepID=A0A2T5MAI1_9EURO|nr:uncharacterized protein P175DRAFT_083265 [Aspergillus ochraceoroseus IBT 24754]PTU25543.1 hypothetical protein P175DRAFT_083265 [Aspergillus ochraceoroseus IBT 24754]